MGAKETDFIIKSYRDEKSGGYKEVLRRYKGNESTVIIPDGVEAIADNAFADDIEPNSTITKIIMPESVKDIYFRAFAFCKSLKEIEFPKTLKHLQCDFSRCPSLEEITIPDGVERIGNLRYTESLRKINVGENITCVSLTIVEKKKDVTCLDAKEAAEILLKNPGYSIKGDFVVNNKHSTTLFRIKFDKSTVRIPKGIETIGTNSFYELYQYTDSMPNIVPVKKVEIPSSVKKLDANAFFGCSSLEKVVYKGLSKDLKISKWAFLMCASFHEDGREIVCMDTPKKEDKKSKTSNLRIERFAVIHKLIKDGDYLNTDKIMLACNRIFWGSDVKKYWSKSTISLDIAFLRARWNAPIVYDHYRRGYFYSEDYSPTLEKMSIVEGM